MLLIQRMHAPLASQLEQAVDFVQWGLPLLVPAFPPFSTLSLAQRQLAVSRCFHHKRLLRDLARAIRLLTTFPYYTDERVRATLGYVEFEHRPRATGLDLTPLTYPRKPPESHPLTVPTRHGTVTTTFSTYRHMQTASEHSVYIQMIGLSISGNWDLAPRGFGHTHLRDAMIELARNLLARGARIAYEGDFRGGGFRRMSRVARPG